MNTLTVADKRPDVDLGDAARRWLDGVALPHIPEADPSDHFRWWWSLGYRSILPVIPPGAPLSERSILFRKLQNGLDPRGKVPGIRGADGHWTGLSSWQQRQTTEADLDQWSAMAASVGLADDGGLLLLDIDATDLATADQIERDAVATFGPAPMRVGAWPKRALVYQSTAPLTFQAVTFAGSNPTKPDRVEVLAGQKQMVVAGVHARTGRPYEWRRPIVPRNQLTMVTPEQVDAFMAAQRAKLPRAELSKSSSASDRSAVNQAALAGDVPTVRKAVAALPNTTAAFPTYDDMIVVGQAIHAATISDPEAGREIFHEWASRWEGGDYDAAITDGRWDTFKAPHGVGASWLFDQSDRHSGGVFSKAELWFEPPGDEPLFPVARSGESAPERQHSEPIEWIDPTAWAGKPVPERQWVVPGFIPEKEVTLLYGDGGVGKTLLMHQFAVCAATGRAWLGQKTKQSRVMLFLCEDSPDELHRRHDAICRATGVTMEEVSGVRIASRRQNDNLLALWDRNTGAMKRQAVWEHLVADAKAWRADVVVVDTLADVYCGNENDRAQVNAFVKGCLGRLGHLINGTVIALGHPSQSGKQTGDGGSGSTGWNNSVRSRLYLTYPKGSTTGDIRELEGKKANYGPKGNKLKLAFQSGAFVAIAGSGTTAAPSPSAAATAIDPNVLVSIEDGAERAALTALAALPGERLNLGAPNSPYYAPRKLKQLKPDILAAYSTEEIEAALNRASAAGLVCAVEIDRDANRRAVFGLSVAADKLSVPMGLFQ